MEFAEKSYRLKTKDTNLNQTNIGMV